VNLTLTGQDITADVNLSSLLTNIDLANNDTDDLTAGSSNLYEGTTVSNTGTVNLTLTTLDITADVNLSSLLTNVDLANNDTDDLSQGASNLYESSTVSKTPSINLTLTGQDITADLNLSNLISNIDLANNDTDDLGEGSSNLYEGSTVSNTADINLTLSTLDITANYNTTGNYSGDYMNLFRSFSIHNITTAHDFVQVGGPINKASTVSGVYINVVGGTNVTGMLYKCSALNLTDCVAFNASDWDVAAGTALNITAVDNATLPAFCTPYWNTSGQAGNPTNTVVKFTYNEN